MKIHTTDRATPHFLIRVNMGEYSNGPPIAYFHIDQGFIAKIKQIQQVITSNPDVFPDNNSYICVSSWPGGGITFIPAEFTNKYLSKQDEDKLSYNWCYTQKPTAKLLEDMQKHEGEGENRVDYCDLKVWSNSFEFHGYMKYGEGNDSIFYTASIPNSGWLPQKELNLWDKNY